MANFGWTTYSDPTYAADRASDQAELGKNNLQAARGMSSLSDYLATAFTGPLDQLSPGWRDRATKSGMTDDAVTSLVSSFATSGQAASLVQSGLARSQKDGSVIDDMLAGRISAADQSTLTQRSAENASARGLWGGAVGGAARGVEARDLGLMQFQVQQAGLKAVGSENASLDSATASISKLLGMQQGAQSGDLSMSLAKEQQAAAGGWIAANTSALGASQSNVMKAQASGKTVAGSRAVAGMSWFGLISPG